VSRVAHHVLDPDIGPDAAAGVEGNSRLTSTTGMLLTILLLVEGFTILDVRGYITLHVALGLILIGPVTLKCATTFYRFVRYYRGDRAYVRKGPPNIVLRLLGPLVVLSTLAVLGTGIALLLDHGRGGTWLTLHQASFIVWISVTGLHFLGHLSEATVGTARELRRARRDPARRGTAARWAVLVASLVVGVGLAAAFTPSASSWQLHRHDHPGKFAPR
jgi:hypothetical protein